MVPRHEGRGRLGGGLHRVRARLLGLGRVSLRLRPSLGRRRPGQPGRHVRARARARRPRRDRAHPLRRARDQPPVAASLGGPVPARERLRAAPRAQGDGARRHPARPRGLGACSDSLARGRVRHRLRLRRAQLPPAPVPLAVLQQAHRRLRRLLREPRAVLARDHRGRARGGRRRLRHRRAHLRGGSRAGRRRPGRRARVRPRRRPPRRPLGRQRRLDRRVVEGLRCVAVLQGGLPARVDRPRARGDREADRRRRAADEPRPHGGDRLQRRLGPDRRGSAVDRRPVPAQEDRGGTLRRDPRVHRDQHVHLEERDRPPPRLHAERDRG